MLVTDEYLIQQNEMFGFDIRNSNNVTEDALDYFYTKGINPEYIENKKRNE